MRIKFEYPNGATRLDDISGLKLSWVKTQSQLNRVEAENISYAIGKYLLKPIKSPLKWFNIPILKKIHKDMFMDVWDWAGAFRTTQTVPGVKPYQILWALKDLCDDVLCWNNKYEMSFLEQAVRIHHRLVFIHPFFNGNGRFARIITDCYLKAWRCSYPVWPSEIQVDSQIRNQYISSLKSADLGDYNQLVDFTKTWGGKDPSLSEVLGDSFYKKNIKTNNLVNLLKAYLKQGYNVNEAIYRGFHPLQLAIKQGLEEILKILLHAGADIFYRDRSGFTSFEMAIIKNQLNIAKIICDHGYPYIPGRFTSPKLADYKNRLNEFDEKYF